MLLLPLTDLVSNAFVANGLPPELGRVIVADRPDLADVQCNGALQGAKLAGKAPRAIAESVVAELQKTGADVFSEISIAGPGFINFKIKPEYLAHQLVAQNKDQKFGYELTKAEKVVVDYCGVNIAKAIHVGHMRPTIIGDAIQRMYRFAGHDVITDVHLGDWGMPMGVVINEVQREQPDLPYFKDGYNGEYPAEPPFSLDDLARLYPEGSTRIKEDAEERKKVRIITAELQAGRPGYRALWRHIVNVSLIDIRKITDFLGVDFDYWYGESDADPYIHDMLEDLKKRNLAVMSEGALVVHVAKEDDKKEMPPVLLVKSDGGVTYGTTDLATIVQREKDFKPDQIVYVFDQRQDLHINQVFRAAELAGYAKGTKLQFAGFGTMNGKDGKPFKTRDGGIPTLREFMDTLIEKAAERLKEVGLDKEFASEDFQDIANTVGLAAMKYGDLMNSPRSDYIFDIEKFVSFEGKTGPYIQYTIVRINSLIRKAADQDIGKDDFVIYPDYHDIALLLLQFPDTLKLAVSDYAPNILADYLFRLSQSVNKFYQTVPVLIEADADKRGAALAILDLSTRILTTGLDLLGIKVPQQM